MKKTATPFAKEMRKIRVDHDLTMKGMAEKLGVKPHRITQYESGKTEIPMDFVHLVQEHFADDERHAQALEDAARESTPRLTFHREHLSPEQWRKLLTLHQETQEAREAEGEEAIAQDEDTETNGTNAKKAPATETPATGVPGEGPSGSPAPEAPAEPRAPAAGTTETREPAFAGEFFD